MDYDAEYSKEHKIFVYEGEQTDTKINALNYSNKTNDEKRKDEDKDKRIELAETLKKAFPPDGLTLEIVLTRPEEVYQFGEELSGEIKEIYVSILENKIK